MAQLIYPPIHADLILHDTNVKVFAVLHLCAMKQFQNHEKWSLQMYIKTCWKVLKNAYIHTEPVSRD